MASFVSAAAEYNRNGYLLYAVDFPGAYARGRTREAAVSKLLPDVHQYCLWCGKPAPDSGTPVMIVEAKKSPLDIADADSDILFRSECGPLDWASYEALRDLCLRSAADFLVLYRSIPDKEVLLGPPRKTFYGDVPRSAAAIYAHTASVNAYYFGEIAVEAENAPDILASRKAGFAALEKQADFLENPVLEGSGGELWSLKKMCRRFLWHDRIHARAMYRRASACFGKDTVADPFHFAT